MPWQRGRPVDLTHFASYAHQSDAYDAAMAELRAQRAINPNINSVRFEMDDVMGEGYRKSLRNGDVLEEAKWITAHFQEGTEEMVTMYPVFN